MFSSKEDLLVVVISVVIVLIVLFFYIAPAFGLNWLSFLSSPRSIEEISEPRDLSQVIDYREYSDLGHLGMVLGRGAGEDDITKILEEKKPVKNCSICRNFVGVNLDDNLDFEAWNASDCDACNGVTKSDKFQNCVNCNTTTSTCVFCYDREDEYDFCKSIKKKCLYECMAEPENCQKYGCTALNIKHSNSSLFNINDFLNELKKCKSEPLMIYMGNNISKELCYFNTSSISYYDFQRPSDFYLKIKINKVSPSWSPVETIIYDDIKLTAFSIQNGNAFENYRIFVTLKGDGNKEYTIKAGYLKGVFWSYGPDEIGKIKTDSNGYGYGEFSTFPESWKNKVISEPDKNALNAVKIEGLLTYNNVFNSANVTFYANNPESNGVWSNDLRYARCNFNTNIEPHLKDRPWWTGNSDNLNSSWFLANGNPNSSIRVFYDSSMPGGAPAYTYTPVNILELQAKHSGCWDVARMMTSDCFAAIHRYCEQEKGYGAGIPQEVSDPNVNVHCFNPGWSGDVNIGELTLKHSGCDSVSKAMTSDCFAAIHRYCEQEKGYAAGVPQEVGSSSIGVHCFNVGWSGDVNIAALTAKGRPCSTSNIMKSDCLADIHRFCEQEKGYGAGISQEVSDPNVNVHCFNPGWDGSSVDQSSNIRGNVKINIGNFDPNFMRDCKFDVYVCSQYSFAENSEDSILKITDSIANFNPASISTIKDYGDFQIIKFNTIRFVLDKDYTIQEIKNAIKTGFRLWEQNGFIYSNFFTNLDWLAAKNNEGLDSSAWAESNDGAIYSGDCWDSVTDSRAVDMDSRKLIGQCTGDICKENLKVRIAFKYKKPSADPLSSRFPKSPLIPMMTFCSEVPVGGTCTGTRECNNPGNPDPVCEAKYGTGSSCLSNCQCQVLPPQTIPYNQDSFTESSAWFVNGATQRGISCWENPSPYSNCYDDFSFFPCGLTSTTLDGKSPAKGQKSLGIQIATINNLRLDITCANGGNGVKISGYPFLNFKVHGITDDYKLNLWAELDRTGTPTQPGGFYDRECPTTAYDFGTDGDWQTYHVDLTKCTKWNGASDGDIFKYLIIGWDHSNTATVYIDNLYFSKT